MGVRSCVGCAAEAPAADQQPTADQQSQGEGSGAPDTADEPATIDEAALRTSLGNDPEAELQKLLKLAENDPQAYKFVAEFPDNYPMEAGEPCTDEVSSGEVPLLLQWDARWGYTVYCSSAFGMTGCGPTSMAMVYQGLTGKNDLTPYDMGQIAQQEGYMYTYSGTDTAFFTAVPARWGISVVQVGVSEVALTEALRSGAVVICNVGPGDFTTDGHFIVLTGLDDEGRLVVNDPYSTVRSEQHWDVSQVISQTRALWAFSI